MAKRRLAILRHAEEITGNVALTCRYYGISRQIFSTWKRRYDAHGLDGLRDRSHRPHVSPGTTRTEVVGKWGCPGLTDRADGSVRLPAR
jgi:transposase-like protein